MHPPSTRNHQKAVVGPVIHADFDYFQSENDKVSENDIFPHCQALNLPPVLKTQPNSDTFDPPHKIEHMTEAISSKK